jgi:hypothetical protein
MMTVHSPPSLLFVACPSSHNPIFLPDLHLPDPCLHLTIFSSKRDLSGPASIRVYSSSSSTPCTHRLKSLLNRETLCSVGLAINRRSSCSCRVHRRRLRLSGHPSIPNQYISTQSSSRPWTRWILTSRLAKTTKSPLYRATLFNKRFPLQFRRTLRERTQPWLPPPLIPISRTNIFLLTLSRRTWACHNGSP